MSTTVERPTAPVPTRGLAGQRRPLREGLFRLGLLVSLVIALSFLLALLIYVVYTALPRLDLDLVRNMPSTLRPETAGAQSAITGTLWVITLTALFCVPIGVMTAIHLEEYADPTKWWNKLIEVNIQNLAAVPSIVYGILGLGVIARGLGLGLTVLSAAITLSLLVLPVVIISAREAIRAVPGSIRFGSLALGATKWQTIWKQVLPAAVPGTATGSILALSRAIGEAAPLLLLGALSYIAFNPDGVLSQFTVLPVQIYDFIKQSREEFVPLASAAIVILLVILLVMNSFAIFLRNKFQRRW
ncbi:MAG: phosphate ABC transporter permease PstA [Actinomycetes bacterium]